MTVGRDRLPETIRQLRMGGDGSNTEKERLIRIDCLLQKLQRSLGDKISRVFSGKPPEPLVVKGENGVVVDVCVGVKQN